MAKCNWYKLLVTFKTSRCEVPLRLTTVGPGFVLLMSVQTPSIDMNGYNRKSPSKRRYEGSKYSSTPKKKARASKERIPQPKNTVAMLNELRHGLVYKLESQTGPVHAPLFTISVEVRIEYKGSLKRVLCEKYFNAYNSWETT
uniref:Uncharacterized protein n=1 Tax=Glossina pallidipes TaxID=7398 RepID=A0A1A9ZA82_GLOPL